MIRLFIVWFEYILYGTGEQMGGEVEASATTREQVVEDIHLIVGMQGTITKVKTLDLGGPTENSRWN